MIEPQGTLYIHQNWYDVDTTKLTSAKDIAELLTAMEMRVSPTSKNFEKVKKFLIIPEKPKTLEEISQELDEKFENLLVKTKRKFAVSKESAEYHHNRNFDNIIENFEIAKRTGSFPQKIKWVMGTGLGALDGAYLVSNGGNFTPSFVVKQGKNHKGYYTFGNQRYFKYYMPDKPTGIVRFFMKVCLGFFWIDEVL